MKKRKAVLASLLVVVAVGGCASGGSKTVAATATASATTTAHAKPAHIAIWSVNSDGPNFRAILTGAVGDSGPGVTVRPNGKADPSHTSELELKLGHGSFRLSIAALGSKFTQSVASWPYNQATCSIHGTVSGTTPVVTGSGTGAYQGIAGSFTLTLSLDEDFPRMPSCSENSGGFQAQILLLQGTGSVRL